MKGYAAEILIAARIMGDAAAGHVIGTRLFGRAVSRTPIRKIIEDVESGELPVTRAELESVVQKDDGAMRFLQANPWLTDPKGEGRPEKTTGRIPKSKKGTFTLPASRPTHREAKAEPGDAGEPPVTPPPATPAVPSPAPAAKPGPTPTAEMPPAKPEQPNPATGPGAPSHVDVPGPGNQPTAEPAPTERPKINWAEVAKKHEEESRLPPPKKPTRFLLPKFVGPPLPPGGTRASKEDRDAFILANEKALLDYAAMVLKLGYVMDPKWQGYGEPTDHATPVNPS